MTEEVPGIALTEPINNSQRLFVRYLVAVLIDLTVLNLFDEFWELVTVDPFSVSVLAAVLLQVLLRATLVLEHKVAGYFNTKSGGFARFMRFFTAWLILFGSKFLMLGASDIALGDDVIYTCPLHGVVSFIVVVMVMLAAEEVAVRIYRRLGRGEGAQ